MHFPPFSFRYPKVFGCYLVFSFGFSAYFALRNLLKEIYQLGEGGFGEYFNDIWNFLDFLTILSLFSFICLSFFLHYSHLTPLHCLVLHCVCFKLLQFYEGFPLIGRKTYVFYECVKNMRIFYPFFLSLGKCELGWVS